MANAINSLNYDNNVYTFTLPYGSCSTAAATAAKTVSVDNFSLETGARVAVKFTVTNTASSPTLNVNSTGAKAIYYNGAAITAGYLKANKVYEFIYNGTQFDFVGDIDTNTNTKNTAGSTDTSSKIYLIGATSQAANPQTYSHDTAYVGTDGCLYSGGSKVLTSETSLSTGSATATSTLSHSGTFTAVTGIAVSGHKITPTTTTYTLPSDNNTTYSAATTSAAGLMSASDKSKLDGITSSADSVSFSQSLTSGTTVGTITINGNDTKLYAPTNTDTHYTTGLKVGASASATANAAASNGSVYLNVLDNTTVRDSHKIVGSGATTVTSDANGVITISSTDNNTTYSAATTSAAGLMSATDKTKLDGIATGANAYTHPSYTARTGKPTANQTPAFGGTATVSQITSDATGHVTGATDRTITIPSTLSNGTGTAGLIKTTSTVTSNSGYTACPVISGVPYYKDTNTTYSLSSFGVTATAAELNALDGITATVTELNYTDGVTSNIQTQLDGKAASSHNHSASNITSGTLAIARGGTGASNGATGLANLFAAGQTVLSSNQYGDSLPTAGAEGRMFLVPDDSVDYVVATGESGIWNYRKWNSGIAECWARMTYSGWATNTVVTFNYVFPFTFVSYPTVTCSTAHQSVYDHWLGQLVFDQAAFYGARINCNSSQNVGGVLNVYAVGWWR